MYDSYADGDYATEGYTEEADIGRGYYEDGYVYASWILRLDRSLLLFYVYVLFTTSFLYQRIFSLRVLEIL